MTSNRWVYDVIARPLFIASRGRRCDLSHLQIIDAIYRIEHDAIYRIGDAIYRVRSRMLDSGAKDLELAVVCVTSSSLT